MIAMIAGGIYTFGVIIFSHYVWGTIITKVIAAFFCGVYFISRLLSRKRLLNITFPHILFLFWLMLALIAGTIYGQLGNVIEGCLTVALVFFVSLLIYNLFVDSFNFTVFSIFFIFSSLLSYFLVRFGVLPPSVPQELLHSPLAREAGTLANSNLFGYVSLVSVAFTFFLWDRFKKLPIKLCLSGVFLLLFFQILQSGLRKALLGLFIIFIAKYGFYLWQNRTKALKSFFIGTSIFCLISFLVGFIIMQSEHGYRIRNIGHFFKQEKLEGGEGSIKHRTGLIKIGLQEFMQHPLIGSGPKSFSEIKVGKLFSRTIGVYSHSNPIEILVSTGLVGFTIYYWMFILIFKKLFRVINSGSKHFDHAILSFVVNSLCLTLFYDLFSVTYYGKEFWIVFSAILGGLTILERQIASHKHSLNECV